jgi:hypothetical protein
MARWLTETLILDATYPSIAEATVDAKAFLAAYPDTSTWDVDTAMAAARWDRGWWSDLYNGFTHDCSLHLPEESSPETCFADRREVTCVNGPFSWWVYGTR